MKVITNNPKSRRKKLTEICYDTRSMYFYYRMFVASRKPVKEKMYSTIIKKMNERIHEKVLTGLPVKLPRGMGVIQLVKSPYISVMDIYGRIITTRYVDWQATHKLWEEDPEAKECKTLIRYNDDFVYYVVVKRWRLINRKYYTFFPWSGFGKLIHDKLQEVEEIPCRVQEFSADLLRFAYLTREDKIRLINEEPDKYKKFSRKIAPSPFNG